MRRKDGPTTIGLAAAGDPLPGRDTLERRIGRSEGPLALAVASPGALAAVNRIWGHEAGDRMLEGASHRLRAAAPAGALVARLSGAKLAALIPAETPDAARDAADRLAGAMAAAAGGPAPDPVLGVAWAPAGSPGLADTLIAAALGAHDRAREDGAEVAVVTVDCAADRAGLGRARRALDAIRSGRATIALQPVVAADGAGRILFREALVRVQAPDGRSIPAGEFMPELERLGMSEEADLAALRLAFDALAEEPMGRVSVNLSGPSITRRRWPETFAALAAARPDCARRLIVEVTEEAAIARAGAAAGLFALVRARGSALALDDFGAGRTSFRHLRDFRFDMVKIDGGFVRGVDASADNRMLISALVAIARQFDMMTVAEFVETAAEARTLRDLGVDGFQGFHFGRPQLVWSGGARDEGRAG